MKITGARNFLTGLVLAGLVAGCASWLQLTPEAGCPGCYGVDPPTQTTTPTSVPVTPLPVIVAY